VNKNELIDSINVMIERLNQSTTNEEAADGWDSEIKSRVEHYFQDVKACINRGVEVEHVGIVRSLDFDGVCRGHLICDIAHIMKRVRKYNNEL